MPSASSDPGEEDGTAAVVSGSDFKGFLKEIIYSSWRLVKVQRTHSVEESVDVTGGRCCSKWCGAKCGRETAVSILASEPMLFKSIMPVAFCVLGERSYFCNFHSSWLLFIQIMCFCRPYRCILGIRTV